MSSTAHRELLTFADELADIARAILVGWRDRPREVEYKPDGSPVTPADREVETALRQHVEARRPADGILGEEWGSVRIDADTVWVLDPIDGTRAFVAGIPVFGTLICAARGGRPVVGVIEHPMTGERWGGAAGLGTFKDGRPVSTSDCRRLRDAILVTSNPDSHRGPHRAGFERLRSAVHWSHYGAYCYADARLASGFVDIACDANMAPHDFGAMVPVIEGAGGVMTDWDGEPLTLASGPRTVAAANPELHALALEALRD